MKRWLGFLFSSALLAACGGGGGGGASLPAPVASSPATGGSNSASFVFKIPSGQSSAGRKLIGPNTVYIVLSVTNVNGSAPVPAPQSLKIDILTDPRCPTSGGVTTCSISYSVPIATLVTIQIATYDASMNALGFGTVTLNTTVPITTPTTVSLGGFPASAQFVQTQQSFAASGSSTPVNATVTLKVKDGEGNLLIPPTTYGSPITIAAVNDINSALTIGNTTLSAPTTVSNASNSITITDTPSKALGSTTAITASFNGTLLATLPIVPLNYTPASLPSLFTNSTPGTITVSEPGYSGPFSVVGGSGVFTATCSASCTPSSAGGTVTINVQGSGNGNATLSVSDNLGTTATIPVTVTGQTGGTVTIGQYKSYLYNTPGGSTSGPASMSSGPDNKSMWFVEAGTGSVAMVVPSSCNDTTTPATCTIHDEGSAQQPYLQSPVAIVNGNDGNMYTTTSNSGYPFLEIASAGTTCTSMQPMTCSAYPFTLSQTGTNSLIARGNDGNLYIGITTSGANSVVQFKPGLNQSTTVPTTAFSSKVAMNELAWGSGGSITSVGPPAGSVQTPYDLWLSDNADGMLGRFELQCTDCTSSAVLVEYGGFYASAPIGSPAFGGIVAGNDGNVWTTMPNANAVAFFSPGACSTSTHLCTVTQIPVASGANPTAIINGPDGHIWFAEQAANKIGIITGCPSACKVNELSIPGASSISSLAVGPDGNVWFTSSATGQIGKVVP